MERILILLCFFFLIQIRTQAHCSCNGFIITSYWEKRLLLLILFLTFQIYILIIPMCYFLEYFKENFVYLFSWSVGYLQQFLFSELPSVILNGCKFVFFVLPSIIHIQWTQIHVLCSLGSALLARTIFLRKHMAFVFSMKFQKLVG